MPAFLAASGIIESTSMTSSAPAAKPSIGRLEVAAGGVGERVAGDCASVQTTATASHSRRIVAGRLAGARACRWPAPIASGRLETKIAASRPTLTPSPAREADAEHRLLGDAVEQRAQRQRRRAGARDLLDQRGRARSRSAPRRRARPPTATGPPTFWPSSKRSNDTRRSARRRRTRARGRRGDSLHLCTRASTPPMTSEDAATAPQRSASDMAPHAISPARG